MAEAPRRKSETAGPSAARVDAADESARYFDFFADFLSAAFACGGFLPSGFGG